ncbi:putative F-box domain, FBD domain, leucine-rich repeat domain, L domain-containing protein [Medicago truncatula]|uniref:Putative F-box domain, FBD domain, leucine-rich repeat domain, L domain-containing protein n=1 Tax=Medicago truncatula TaxID=3880 RepID=A0A396IYC7_MEDTR|nr:putative F-box domain, FBD domain, leucine-rich repeat domain, L domain-containing protein [Medicago truncatula]
MTSFSCWRSIPTVDRISDMPDSILSHILSFLPTKLAVTTTILSKRWKPVWRSVFTLDFDDKTFPDFNSFRRFVDLAMFRLRDKKTDIYSFTFKLSHSSRFDQRQFDRILKFVMERGVKNLKFNMTDKQRSINLPPRILSCKTLQILTLGNLLIKKFDKVDFPLVKTLHLDRVFFTPPQCFVKFIYGFPILEDLNTKSFLLSSPELFDDPAVKLNALLNLAKVRICYGMDDMMTLFCKAKILHLEQCARRGKGFWKYPPTVPDCLSSQLKTCCVRSYIGTEYEFKFVKYIMQHSNVLETMTIQSTCLENDRMKLKLSSCTRGSTTCKLLFD